MYSLSTSFFVEDVKHESLDTTVVKHTGVLKAFERKTMVACRANKSEIKGERGKTRTSSLPETAVTTRPRSNE